MKKFSFASLRSRLMLVVFLAMVPSLLLVAHLFSVERRTGVAAAEANALRLAQLASYGHARLIHGARELLTTLSELPEIRSADPAAATALLQRILPNYQFYVNLGLVSLDGNVIASAVPMKDGVSVAELPWFRQAVQSREFAVGEYQTGNIPGHPQLNFGYPVLDANGEVQAIVFVSLDLFAVGRSLFPVDLPPGSELVLTDRQGLVLARQPPSDQKLGLAAPQAEILKSVSSYHGEGATQVVTDAGAWLYAYSPVGTKRGVDGYASIGIPLKTAYASATRQLRDPLLALALVLLLAVAAARWLGDVVVLRPVKALARAAQEVKAGDFKARTGLPNDGSELGQLAQVFDEMAMALQQRDAELKKAAEALRRANEDLERRVQERTRELAEQRTMLQSLVEHIPDFIYIKDIDGRYVVDNAAHRGLVGVRSLDDVVGKTVYDLYPRELADKFTADDKAVLAAQTPLLNRSEFVTDKRGHKIPVLTSKVPWRDKDGKLIGLVCIGRNTGEQAGPVT
jgi:PAS domain S-box-containing protein